ncbi:MarR family winged helix-turn-helix transcriptional regulator [Kineosporia succinea]|uniref:DNA-binding MarR family transcriptional regulator n=1 Tax=Kineosporia succinea TaxID=84632 RepID=A0ABT9P916_9ACTN|nr:MarR family transcriptional regulator [Kineosporia succinea]MDP9829178.1 DNA-binding MarR family transcriptional regulator [Kineosporia succinea]
MQDHNSKRGTTQRRHAHGDTRPEAVRAVRAMAAFATESEMYLAATGRDESMHRTDLNALRVVMAAGSGSGPGSGPGSGGPMTPRRLSEALQLSAPATSAMLDRLERLGHVERQPHPSDRRSVVVVATEHAHTVGASMFGRVGARMAPVLASRSAEELAVIASFLEDASAATSAARADIDD